MERLEIRPDFKPGVGGTQPSRLEKRAVSRHLQPDGRVHGAVVGCRREDGRWLLIRRSESVWSPLKVCFPGGGVDAGEAHPQAAVREMQEELGARIQLVRCVWHVDLPHLATTLWGWRAELVVPELTPDPAEVSEVLWLTPDEARAHPDALPATALFLAALLRSDRMARVPLHP